MSENKFQFELGQSVVVAASGEKGAVCGRAEYVNSANNYFIHYKAADGRAVSDWWTEELLIPA